MESRTGFEACSDVAGTMPAADAARHALVLDLLLLLPR
jgi:hypothetical protein